MSENEKTIEASRRTRRKPKVGGMDTGRPSDIDAPFDLRPDGTTRTISEAICDYVRQGLGVTTAIARAGQKRPTVHGWLEEAGRIDIRATAGTLGQLTPHEHKCRDFAAKLAQAKAENITNEWDRHANAAFGGGRVTEVRSERRFRGPNDTVGYLWRRFETVKTLPPDTRAIEWRLSKVDPGRFGNLVKIQVEDAPLSDEEQAATLAEELTAFLATREADVVQVEQETKT